MKELQYLMTSDPKPVKFWLGLLDRGEFESRYKIDDGSCGIAIRAEESIKVVLADVPELETTVAHLLPAIVADRAAHDDASGLIARFTVTQGGDVHALHLAVRINDLAAGITRGAGLLSSPMPDGGLPGAVRDWLDGAGVELDPDVSFAGMLVAILHAAPELEVEDEVSAFNARVICDNGELLHSIAIHLQVMAAADREGVL